MDVSHSPTTWNGIDFIWSLNVTSEINTSVSNMDVGAISKSQRRPYATISWSSGSTRWRSNVITGWIRTGSFSWCWCITIAPKMDFRNDLAEEWEIIPCWRWFVYERRNFIIIEILLHGYWMRDTQLSSLLWVFEISDHNITVNSPTGNNQGSWRYDDHSFPTPGRSLRRVSCDHLRIFLNTSCSNPTMKIDTRLFIMFHQHCQRCQYDLLSLARLKTRININRKNSYEIFSSNLHRRFDADNVEIASMMILTT